MTLWERILGFFVDRKLVVLIAMGLLVFEGLRVAPFPELAFDGLPRDPVPVDAVVPLDEDLESVFRYLTA